MSAKLHLVQEQDGPFVVVDVSISFADESPPTNLNSYQIESILNEILDAAFELEERVRIINAKYRETIGIARSR